MSSVKGVIFAESVLLLSAAPNANDSAFQEFCMVPAFRLISVKSASVSDNSSMLYINKLEELPMTIGKLNKKAAGNNAVIVGFVTKPSHEDFAKRGSFPMNPTPNGLIFVLLSFETPLSSQLQVVGVVLHKATDEILSMNWEAIQNLLTESHTPQACRSCKGSEFGFFAESWYYLDRKVVILGVAVGLFFIGFGRLVWEVHWCSKNCPSQGLRSGQDSLGNDKVGSDLNSVGACSWGFTVYGVGFRRGAALPMLKILKCLRAGFFFGVITQSGYKGWADKEKQLLLWFFKWWAFCNGLAPLLGHCCRLSKADFSWVGCPLSAQLF
ncbi:hypothetical protein Pint_26406 [Pistacia integerrima]|uniref:Uncharacterized protein n=1 Tax=Pistacia integerrima TaxID=434235 RepID=A0ACC0YIG9_9ROSI|nr:hypothetical protein Pint_26406 [Pistacia integerrima]